MPSVSSSLSTVRSRLELLVLQFALELLRLGNLANSLVEIVLTNSVAVTLDGEEPTADPRSAWYAWGECVVIGGQLTLRSRHFVNRRR